MTPIWIKGSKGYVRVPYEHMHQDEEGRWYFETFPLVADGPATDFIIQLGGNSVYLKYFYYNMALDRDYFVGKRK